MRIAALYDIHGNLPALEAVLEQVLKTGVDQIVFGVDVGLGPMSGACLDKLSEIKRPVFCIQGNCEVAILEQMEGRLQSNFPKPVLEAIRWTADRLLPRHQALMAQWPKTLRLKVEGLGRVLFCHATPRSETENFTCLTPEEKLLPIFEEAGADVVVCGHTHMQFDRKIGSVRVINAGSLGMPFGKPGAYWLELGLSAELKYLPYDLTAAADRMRKTAYPLVDEFIENYLVNPPSEEQMQKILNGE